MTLLADVVATSATVTATTKRNEKRDALAALLGRLGADEVVPVIGFLTGVARQGRIGVGYSTVFKLDVPPAAEPSLTVADLDEALTALAETSGAGSQAARTELLTDLLSRSTAEESDFVRRLLVGELRQGALAGVVTDAVSTAAGVPLSLTRRAAMLTGDLGRTALLALTEGAPALESVGLVPLHAVEPMLASTAESVAAAVGELGLASVEWKLDGARIQAHRAGDEVRIYTRNLNDVTDRLPEVLDVVRRIPAEQVVLDGEVLGVLAGGDDPHAFQDTMSRFSRDDHTSSQTVLVPWFFDVLHVDGTDLIDEPLSHRREVLAQLVPEHLVPGVLTDSVDAAEAVLGDALAKGHEGVMVKAASSTYEAGRRGKAWRKVKPVRTLDLVVLGAEWGSGRRRGWLSNLHLGARDPEGGGFVMVGKTFKGLTDELLRWQTEAIRARAVREEGHTVFVRPELVVEIALDGAQASTRYPGGVALRFARVKGYRPDKDPSDADTLEAVRALLPRARAGGDGPVGGIPVPEDLADDPG